MAKSIETAWTPDQCREVIVLQARAIDLLNECGAFDPDSPAKTADEFLRAIDERFLLVALDPENTPQRQAVLNITMVGQAGVNIETGVKGMMMAVVQDTDEVVAQVPTPTPSGEDPSLQFIVSRMSQATIFLNEAFSRAKEIEAENLAAGRLIDNLPN